MNFSEALKAMKMGSKVSREAWRGVVSYYRLKKNGYIEDARPDGTKEEKEHIHVGDIFAEDWFLVT